MTNLVSEIGKFVSSSALKRVWDSFVYFRIFLEEPFRRCVFGPRFRRRFDRRRDLTELGRLLSWRSTRDDTLALK